MSWRSFPRLWPKSWEAPSFLTSHERELSSGIGRTNFSNEPYTRFVQLDFTPHINWRKVMSRRRSLTRQSGGLLT
jgi:hypothetical protein